MFEYLRDLLDNHEKFEEVVEKHSQMKTQIAQDTLRRISLHQNCVK